MNDNQFHSSVQNPRHQQESNQNPESDNQSEEDYDNMRQQAIDQQFYVNFSERVDLYQLSPSYLYYAVSGVLEGLTLSSFSNLQVKLSLVYGTDWELLSRKDQWITQEAKSISQYNSDAAINYPFEIVFKTSGITGWPQLVIQVYSRNFIGLTDVFAYSNIHLPIQQGHHSRKAHCYKLKPVTFLGGLMGKLKGIRIEYKNPIETISQGLGREMVRTQTQGTINFSFDVYTHNFDKYGFTLKK